MTDDLVVTDAAGGIVTVSFNEGSSGRTWVDAVNRSPPEAVADGGQVVATDPPTALRCHHCGGWPVARETSAGTLGMGCGCTVVTDLEDSPGFWLPVDGGGLDG